MYLDSWSLILALTLSGFAFLIFLFWNKKAELVCIDKQVKPASEEAHKILVKNFLSLGEIPSKSKLISIMTSVARKYSVHLLSHLPVHAIIDNLIYHVISNDLLDANTKKQMTDRLIKLKTEPISSEDYIYLVVEGQEYALWKQKFAYSQVINVLLGAMLGIIFISIISLQFKSTLSTSSAQMLQAALLSLLGFSFLVAGFALARIVMQLLGNKKGTQKDLQALLPAHMQQNQGLFASSGISAPNSNAPKLPSKTNNSKNAHANPAKPHSIKDLQSLTPGNQAASVSS